MSRKRRGGEQQLTSPLPKTPRRRRNGQSTNGSASVIPISQGSRVQRLLASKDELAKLESNHAVVINLRSGESAKQEAACMILATWFQQALNCEDIGAPIHRHLQDLIENNGLVAGLTEAWSIENMRKVNDIEIAKKSGCLSVLIQCALYIFHVRNSTPLLASDEGFLSKDIMYCLMSSFDEVLIKLQTTEVKAQKRHRKWFNHYGTDFLSFITIIMQLAPALLETFLHQTVTVANRPSLFGGKPLVQYLTEAVLSSTFNIILAGHQPSFSGAMCLAATEVLVMAKIDTSSLMTPQSYIEMFKNVALSNSPNSSDENWMSCFHVALLAVKLLRTSLTSASSNQTRELTKEFVMSILKDKGNLLFNTLRSSVSRSNKAGSKSGTEESVKSTSQSASNEEEEAADDGLLECCDRLQALVTSSLDSFDGIELECLFGLCLTAIERFRVEGLNIFQVRSDQDCVWQTLCGTAGEVADICTTKLGSSVGCSGGKSAFESLEASAATWIGLLTTLDGNQKMNVSIDDETTDDLFVTLGVACSLLVKNLSSRASQQSSYCLTDEMAAKVFIGTLTAIAANVTSVCSKAAYSLLTALCPVFEVLGNTRLDVTDVEPFILKRLVTRILLKLILLKPDCTELGSASLLVCGAQCLIDNYQDPAFDRIAVEEGLGTKCAEFEIMVKDKRILESVSNAFGREANEGEDVRAFMDYYQCLFSSLSQWEAGGC